MEQENLTQEELDEIAALQQSIDATMQAETIGDWSNPTTADILGMEPEHLVAFRGVLETISNFYMDGTLSVKFEESESAYCTNNGTVCLPPSLIDEFFKNKLPKFCVYYHELGHAIYSKPSFDILDLWKNFSAKGKSNTSASPIRIPLYNPKYLHLINWIEDFYIESKLIKDYTYLEDIIRCLKLVPIKYNVQDLDKAFHYYYIYGQPTPSLTTVDSLMFENYITSLLKIRSSNSFGKGIISVMSNNVNRMFVTQIDAFYNWCVSKNIFPKDVTLPPLQNPVMDIEYTNVITGQYSSNLQDVQGLPGDPGTFDTPDGSSNMPSQLNNDPLPGAGVPGGPGSRSDHSHLVGIIARQKFPEVDLSKPIFSKELATESKLIKAYIKESAEVESNISNLNGLFSSNYEETTMIAKPIVKNFYNPNKLADRYLFKDHTRTFNNVSIYRDISGSTHGKEFTVINEVCKEIIDNVPFESHFYLYASGNISIVETEFIDWDIASDAPIEYENDPLFQQLGGGTNSGAIGDVITEQLDDQWLNIIVTDGDLDDLFDRDDINSLLDNVAVISIGSDIHNGTINPEHYVRVDTLEDISKIYPMLMNFRKEVK